MSRRLLPVLATAVVIATGAVASPASAERVTPDVAPSVSAAHAKQALSQVRDLLSPRSRSAAGSARTALRTRGDVTLALRDLSLARRSLTGADRREADAFLARPTADEGAFDPDVFDYSPTELASLQQQCSDHFCVTYTTAVHQGMYVNSETGEVLDNHATSTDAAQDLAVLEHVYDVEISTLGFRPPVSDAATVDATPNNVDGKIDIYLTNLGVEGIYGYCAPDPQSTLPGLEQPAYCVLDNDFAKSQFGAAPERSRDVTAAHEFFHAIQYAYNVNQDGWFMEGSAVWMEDEVYNSTNDYLQYVPASPIRRPLTPFNTDGSFTMYGDFSLFKFLSGYLHTRDAVRQAWLAAAADGTHLGSLQAVEHVLAAHHRTLATAWSTFGLWNTLPPSTYPERLSYRPAGAWHSKKLTTHSRTAGTWRVALKALANAPVSLTPGSSLSRHSRLTITVNAPDVSAGGAATLQVRYRNGHVGVSRFGINRRGDRTRTVTFNPHKVSRVVVVLSNTSASAARTFSVHAHAS